MCKVNRLNLVCTLFSRKILTSLAREPSLITKYCKRASRIEPGTLIFGNVVVDWIWRNNNLKHIFFFCSVTKQKKQNEQKKIKLTHSEIKKIFRNKCNLFRNTTFKKAYKVELCAVFIFLLRDTKYRV